MYTCYAVTMKQEGTTATNDMLAQLTESNGFLIAMIGNESRRRVMAQVNRWDVGWPHQRVLSALLALGPDGTASQKHLSACVQVDPRNLVAILDTPEERKLVERVPNPKDRRSYGITLTQS